AELARQAIALAEESGDPALYVTMATNVPYALFSIGEYRDGVAICDRALELAAGDVTVGAGMTVGCPVAWCHAMKGLLLGALGELEEARKLTEQGSKLAREQGDIEGVGYIHMWSAWLGYFRGEPEAALGHAEQSLE